MPYIEAKTPVGKTLLSAFFSFMAVVGLIGGLGGNGGAWVVFAIFGVCAFLAWQNTLAHQRSELVSNAVDLYLGWLLGFLVEP
jgi:hypothetical protein